MEDLTVEAVKKLVPKKYGRKVTEDMVEKINNATSGVEQYMDSVLLRENIFSYSNLLGPGVGMDQLIKAIKYCTIRTYPGMTNEKAYRIINPDKAVQDRDLSGFTAEYNKTKLVTELTGLMLTPDYLTYLPDRYQMLEKLKNLSNGIGAHPDDRVSPTVQMNSAIGFLDKTQPPEEKNIQIGIGPNEEAKSIQANLADQLAKMADVQMKRLQVGEDISSVQKIGIQAEIISEADIDE